MNVDRAIVLTIIGFGLVALYFIILLYNIIFRPWHFVEDELRDIEMHIETLKKGGWRAKFYSWISMPVFKGDVEKHLEYLLGLRELKRAELELFEKVGRR